MSYVITSGGTAGHINPALAVAAELERLGKHVIFVGSIGGMEERLARNAGLKYKAFAAKGFNRQNPFSLLSSSVVLAHSTCLARTWLREIDAQAVGAFGGYVSVPVGRAAVRENIPLLIHEQNSSMGWANKHLSKHAQVIALSYDAASDALDARSQERVTLTGNPVRPEFSLLANAEYADQVRREFRNELGVSEDALVLLIFGGSQGARHINQSIVRLAPELLKRPELSVVHLTGQKELESIQIALTKELGGSIPKRWKLMGYCDRMPSALAAADAVVSRAGASSLAELAAAAKPALLVPYPYAAADHQRKNAKALVDAGAAVQVLDAELDSPRFSTQLFSLIDDAEQRARMLQAAQKLKEADAATKVAELLIEIAQR